MARPMYLQLSFVFLGRAAAISLRSRVLVSRLKEAGETSWMEQFFSIKKRQDYLRPGFAWCYTEYVGIAFFVFI